MIPGLQMILRLYRKWTQDQKWSPQCTANDPRTGNGHPAPKFRLWMPVHNLNWHSLELRRKISRLTIMCKIVDSKIAVDIPDYIARPTRSTRSYHSKRFINISSNSNTYKYNFFTRTLKEWNALPSSLLDQPSVQSFKTAVTDYLSSCLWFRVLCIF